MNDEGFGVGGFNLQTIMVIGLVAALAYVAIWGNPFDPSEGIGFVTYLELEDGSIITLDANETITLNITPLALTTPSGRVINKIYQRVNVNPTWGGAVDPANPNATVDYVTHKNTWRENPSGANLNQVTPVWSIKNQTLVPLNEETEIAMGPTWDAGAWANATIGVQPSGTYWIDTELTLKGTYNGNVKESTGYGGMQVKWTQDTLTLTIGWQGHTSFILG